MKVTTEQLQIAKQNLEIQKPALYTEKQKNNLTTEKAAYIALKENNDYKNKIKDIESATPETDEEYLEWLSDISTPVSFQEFLNQALYNYYS